MTIKQSLQGAGFKPHNNKAAELVASKFHSSLRNVRIVCRTGTNKNTGKTIGGKQTQFQAVYINKQGQWRTIASGSTFKGTTRFASALTAIEVGAEEASTCKCGAKKFKAKSGNVVCADACWANNGWSSKKKWQGTKNNSTSQPKPTSPKGTSRSAAGQKAHRAKILQDRKEAKKKTEGIYTTFVPGQLVKIVEPQQNTLADFIGTVTKVEPLGNDPKRPLVNVWVMWMHSGVTDRHHNYRASIGKGHAGTDTYLVSVG
jgi:nitrite reductase/ring-hydroxylating ferredoxin subunit